VKVVAVACVVIAASLEAQSPPPTLAAATKTYDAVVQGMSCKQRSSGEMDCEYKVGNSLRFVIARVGQKDVAVTFLRVDADNDYFASVVPLHSCVVVKPARASDTTTNLAFVSPQDGKIHRSWNACLKTGAAKR
jgi:hypothetical protein